MGVRGLATRLVGAASLMMAGAWPAAAQLTPETRARVDALEREVDGIGWEVIANADCRSAGPDGIAAAREWLQRVQQNIPRMPAGRETDRTLVAARRGARIDRLEITGRIEGTLGLLYMGEPARPDSAAPAVLIVPGPGTLAHQAFGIRLSGDDSLIVHKTPPFLWGLALPLLDAGMRVSAIDLSDDVSQWPRFAWQDVARRSALYRRRLPGTLLSTMAYSQLLSALDHAASMAPGGVVLIGWGDGAQLAAMLATDPRVRALVRLAPPLDRPTLRRTAAGVQRVPAILASDCGVSETALSSLAAPRPQLIAYTRPDRTGRAAPDTAPAVASAVLDSIAAAYRRVNASAQFAVRAVQADSANATLVRSWLRDTRLIADGAPLNRTLPPANAPVGRYPARQVIDAKFVNNRVAVGPGCAPRGLPSSVRTLGQARRETERLRAQLRAALRPDSLPASPRFAIDTLGRTNAFVILAYRELDRLDGARGLAAIPRQAPAAAPLVLQYNGLDGALLLLDRRARSDVEYLNAAGALLASRGFVVVIPLIPEWFPDGGTALLEGRTWDPFAGWRWMYRQYAMGLSFALGNLDVDPGSVTGYGISFGGEALLVHAALDPRIRRVLYSNPISDPARVFGLPDAAVLGTWQTAICEYETALRDVLLVPRPLLWENGAFDTNGDAPDPFATVRAVREVYEFHSAGDLFHFVRHGGGHATRPTSSLLDLLLRP